MDDTTDLARIERAVGKMRKFDREVFLAIRLDDLSYEQIAQATGLRVAQVKRIMLRALCTLDREMAQKPRRWRLWPF